MLMVDLIIILFHLKMRESLLLWGYELLEDDLL